MKPLINKLLSFLGYEIRRIRSLDIPLNDSVPYVNFKLLFELNLDTKFIPHPQYNVFTQYDKEFYLANREAFEHKYQVFWAISKTISPKVIVELGTLAGSSADAYLSASPDAHYIGYDWFGEGYDHSEGKPWRPDHIANRLLIERGYNYKLIKADLRQVKELPKADLVVVDAGHDYANAYLDLKLALTAKPEWIWVDDYGGEVKEATQRLLEDVDLHFTFHADYFGGGGLLIKLNSRLTECLPTIQSSSHSHPDRHSLKR